MNAKRLFLAIEIPEPIRRQLLSPLKARRHDGVRPSPAEQLHITLRFLGETPPELQKSIEKTLKELPSWRPFELTLEGSGLLPSRRQPKVLYVGIRESEGLLALKESIDAALFKARAPGEGGKFRPHLTVARLKDNLDRELCQSLPAVYGKMKPLTFKVEAFSLHSSELRPTGAVHTLEAGYKAKL